MYHSDPLNSEKKIGDDIRIDDDPVRRACLHAANHPELNLAHLEMRMRQSGHWKGEATHPRPETPEPGRS
jgi:hypothetical protein